MHEVGKGWEGLWWAVGERGGDALQGSGICHHSHLQNHSVHRLCSPCFYGGLCSVPWPLVPSRTPYSLYTLNICGYALPAVSHRVRGQDYQRIPEATSTQFNKQI